jgi:hypothetical protein
MRSGWIPTRNVARISVRNCTYISTTNGTPSVYKTRAEDNGFVFLSTMSISESSSGSIMLTSSHVSEPQGIAAKLMSIPMGLFFKGVAKKALLQDLKDIKSAVEQK